MISKIRALFLLFIAFSAHAQVVINEIDADTPSTDVKEFIELKSATPFFALDGYVLVFFNASSTGTLNQSYLAIDLDGLVTDGNGIIMLGNAQVVPAPSYLIPDNTIQNGPDGVAIYLGDAADFPLNTTGTSANLVDAFVYSNNANTKATTLMAAWGLSVSYNENANNQAANQSIQRKNDGTFEVKAPTPRANNDGSGIIYNGITTTWSPNGVLSEGDTVTLTFTTDVAVTSALSFNVTLSNGSFNTADFTGNLNITIPAGSNSASTNILLRNDGVNDGDEEMKISIGTVPADFVVLNNNILVRVNDVNFVTLPFGTPANPTYGLVASTQPAGYYDSLEGKSGAALKQALQDIIANPAVVRAHTYADVVNILKTADQNPLNSNQVWLIYTEQPRSKIDYQTSSSIVGKWNREHIYCQSRGNFGNLYNLPADGINVWAASGPDDIGAGLSDAHHIRAVDGQENTSRNNRNYGVDYNGPIANPTSSWKGDVARACFYMAVRYNGLNVVNGNPNENVVGQIGDLATLLQWNLSDPADDYEMNRNNYIYTWQMNRNPFIDHPALANYLWGSNAGQTWFSALADADFSRTLIGLYPNPAQHQVALTGEFNQAEVTIYTLTGAQVLQTTAQPQAPISLNLARGLYLVKIKVGQQLYVRKLTIQ